MYDLPDLGASIKLMQPREVKRNFYEAQPDPRKATEIPPQAVANSSAKLEQQRMMRINAEADRIMKVVHEIFPVPSQNGNITPAMLADAYVTTLPMKG